MHVRLIWLYKKIEHSFIKDWREITTMIKEEEKVLLIYNF